MTEQTAISAQLVKLARDCGASLAGPVAANRLRVSPSHVAGEASTLQDWVSTVLVIALHHPEDQPELDHWGGYAGSRGNLALIRIANRIARRAKPRITGRIEPLKYPPVPEGTYIKDAAVLAGLGVIGRNNLVVTPEYGPRIRLASLALEAELPVTERADGFDPCAGCPAPCMSACPQNAFPEHRFSRPVCDIQMKLDGETREMADDPEGYLVSFCRRCELACPVGMKGEKNDN